MNAESLEAAPRFSRLTLFSLATVVALSAVWLTGPSSFRAVPPSNVETARRTVRGAFHIHTRRSDGALDKEAVAAAAARAGLQFAIFTDHGNGMRPPDPPAYLHGVLCLDGVEVSTNQGHYIAVAMPQAPYPLGGDASAVAEDVSRLGGFGVAAHPLSPRSELAWTDPQVPVDGIEWLNADSEWRDERRWRLGRAALDYVWRPTGSLAALLDRPVDALQRWDAMTATREVVGLAGLDAHGGFGAEADGQRGRRLHIPSYEASFRTFSTYAILTRPVSQEPSADAKLLVEALRTGAVFSAVDAIASPAALDFRATTATAAAPMGQVLRAPEELATFSVRAAVPAGATTVLIKDGDVVAQASGGVLDHQATSFGVYRVEIGLGNGPGSPPVPWLVSNPIYWRRIGEEHPAVTKSTSVAAVSLSGQQWRVEADPGSSGAIASTADAVTISYRLKDFPVASQFAALVVDLQSVPADVDAISFRGVSVQPARVSVQLRYARHDDGQRWGRSVYLDQTERELRVPIRALRYIGERDAVGAGRSRPAADAATSLLFVIDLTNSLPGSQGSLTFRGVSLSKD